MGYNTEFAGSNLTRADSAANERKGNRMNLEELMDKLQDCIIADESILCDDVKSLRTFEEAELLTKNKGLVLVLDDRSEFHITVVKSK